LNCDILVTKFAFNCNLYRYIEALETARGGRGALPAGLLEGYAVGQASLEDVFLDFAQRGAEQSDAQLMARDDALFAYRKGLSETPARG
jgi:hypothetical protein